MKLISLKGCPKVIDGSFACNDNKLKSLEYCPEVINGSFSCGCNKLKSLEYCPEVINGGFYCNDNKLTDLKYSPKFVTIGFDCSNNKLKSLKYVSEKIKGSFDCNNNQLTSLKEFSNINLKGYLSFKDNKIKEEELVNFNCNIENVKNIYSDFNEDGDKEEFLNKVNYYKNIKEENELLKELSINRNNIKLNKKL